MSVQTQRKSKVLSRKEVEGLIANGRSIVIVDGKVLKVDAWLPYHPGGDKAIRHMIGRDATDEVTRFHSSQTLELMNRYQIGRVEAQWTNFLPPIQGGKFRTQEELERLSAEAYTESCSSSEQDTTSSSSSAEHSPIFEPVDRSTSTTRKRNASNLPRASSSSSISSVGLDDAAKPATMSVLDRRTQQELDFDKAKYPSLDAQTQNSITQKYRELQDRIESEGLYKCNYASYGIECLRYGVFLCTFLYMLHAGWYISSAVPLACLWHQLTFTVHDAGHMGVTHDFTTDTTIAMFIASYMGGLSACWWKYNHNVHHLVTNHPEHDPDIQYIPFFAITHRFLESLTTTYYEWVMHYDAFAKALIPIQQYTYYPIMLFARFNLYRLSWVFLLSGTGPKKGPAWWHRYFELVGISFFWTWFGYGVVYRSIPDNFSRFWFVLISHALTSPLHIQITLSHFAMSTADLGVHESFAQKMLRTTMDVDCPQWLDFFHGGLQFQAIHHLFPRIPRHNLRRTQKLVQEFCNEVDIPYALYGFVDGNKRVIGRLADVGRQASILAECQRAIAAEGDYGLH
ncbi:fatty acid desaturase [Dothidotthia symphoricarpi CBS 119687]|uniref:Delta 8-(E)-sphingolipid desaturase n=1 Tax=Dothidotthia symphoricarpi CBS 119687 TaxID=1392245 RepID=A0A6A6ASC6_9PLEO|nr:fatty acid desaturase [Dothidotthia symphoricarpi CBS 119687]KAF2134466.1 fatty acid desaturase [Dothidotthia symphoricarpi CBS 119687]